MMRIIQIIIMGLMLSLIACKNKSSERTYLGIKYAKKELTAALKDTIAQKIFVDTLINDKETAIGIAEKILFKIYGREKIIEQQPYEVNFIEGYWVLNGTLPKKMKGGTFLIIIKSKDGQVIKLHHSK